MQKLIIMAVITFVLLPAAPDARAALVAANEKVQLYTTGNTTLSAKDVENIIQAATGRASSGNVSWKVLNFGQGQMELQGGKPDNYATFSLIYTGNSITLTYKDSQGLNYRKNRRGQPVIHPAYNKWVDRLTKEIISSAKFINRIDLITSTSKNIRDQRAKGAALMILAVEADPGYEDESRHAVRNWSTKIMKTVAETINEEFRNKLVAKPLPWSRDMIRLARKGYSAKRNKLYCEKHIADRVLTIYIQFEQGDNTFHSYREAKINYFDCNSGKKFGAIKSLGRTPNDSFPFEGSFREVVPKFLKDNGINE